MKQQWFNRYPLMLVACLLAAGCGKDAEVIEITETREGGVAPEIPEHATSANRFGYSRLPDGHPSLDGAAELPPGHPPISGSMPAPDLDAPVTVSIGWDVPDGWAAGKRRPMRIVTLLSGKDRTVECYISELGGLGGGLEANLTRWSGQMGQGALSAEDIAALPTLSVLGQEVPVLAVDGDYRGMGGTSRAGSTLLGVVANHGSKTYFIKMIGPREEVAKQREAFNAFCTSLRVKELEADR